MPLPLPNLDDRDYGRLVEDAMATARRSCPEWTDGSPSDPGRALVEAFAYLTDVMLFRLNRLPAKLFVAFLNLLGAELRPPSAATVTLRFTRKEGAEGPVEVPAGTAVADESGLVQFVTLSPASLGAANSAVDVLAIHGRWVEGERIGISSGEFGQTFALKHAPVIAPTPFERGLQLGVEGEIGEGLVTRSFQDRAFVLWDEIDSAVDLVPEMPVFFCARASGRIILPPARDARDARLPGVPPKDRELRAWYLTGGGPSGNVAAGRLTRLVDRLENIEVTNPDAAGGGRAAETLDQALQRVPREFFSFRRAVTARDFELVASLAGGVARAHARTRSSSWRHGAPGQVDVLVVPEAPSVTPGEPVTRETLNAVQTEQLRRRIQQALDERKPLGVEVDVGWVRAKPLSIKVTALLHPEEEPVTVARRIEQALDELISPLGSWPLGAAINPADVYRIVLNQPGVRTARDVFFEVTEVPDEKVRMIAADPHQDHAWFACAGDRVFRSLNDAASWEAVASQDEYEAQRVICHPDVPGLACVLWGQGDPNEGRSRLVITRDCGESWDGPAIGFDTWVYDVTWLPGRAAPTLLVAARTGLYQWVVGEMQVRLSVAPTVDDRGFYAVTTTTTPRGRVIFAVAAREAKGVFVAYDRAEASSFRPVGLSDKDIRTLVVAERGARRFLWAGARAAEDEAGEGAFQLELPEQPDEIGGFTAVRSLWRGGSCLALAFASDRVFAASYDAGVLQADLTVDQPQWEPPEVTCGLPLRSEKRLFKPILGLACRVDEATARRLVLAGGEDGIYQADGAAKTFHSVSERAFSGEVPLPATWLFCSGAHDVKVAKDDAL